ncbi:class I SAM-dependent methyltransferase [Kineococcus rhizosphaerae]|uniref:Putative nicotinamide N-methyase n=1 Tax=Kineococcus rhizosphaerae TaxID=559628 RepID=A0A2T0R1R1_9ACTN|nr:methyltransferase domain-containing protein [Kineococcus rhizosphaerae]PRY13453.1 putative nicotinamide N-methyase [Kineococcus rhizosphaerae]
MPELVERSLLVAGAHLDLLLPGDLEELFTEEAYADERFAPYWAELWPSALALADAVAGAAPARLLEFGCGLGVPSIRAARAGHAVTATDWTPTAIDLLTRNAARNAVALTALPWDWTTDPAPLRPPFDLVVAADVLYERRQVDTVLAALPALVAPGGQVWVADPGRPAADEFVARARADWSVDRLAHTGPSEVTIHRLRAAA